MSAPLCLKQKAPRHTLEFTFHDDYLAYLNTAQISGNGNRFNVDYKQLPPTQEYYDVFQRQGPDVLFACATICGFYYFYIYPWILYYNVHLPWSVHFAMPILAFLSAWQFAGKLWKKFPDVYRANYTLIPMEDNRHILIFQDKKHNEILDILAQKRREALRQYLEVDSLLDPLWQLKRLRWLCEQSVINFAELAGAEESIRRHFPDLSFQPYGGTISQLVDEAPELTYQQKKALDVQQFDFYKDHLRYRTTARAFNVRYDSIKSHKENEEILQGDTVYPFLYCVLFTLGCMSLFCFYIIVNQQNPVFFQGNYGLFFCLHTLVAIIASFAAVFSSIRIADRRYTHVLTNKGPIAIQHDMNKDTILEQINKRRVAALRKLAFISDLNTKDEEARKFYFLKQEGVISENEYQAFKERIAGTQFNGAPEIQEKKLVLN